MKQPMFGGVEEFLLWSCIAFVLYGLGVLSKVVPDIKLGVSFVVGFVFLGLVAAALVKGTLGKTSILGPDQSFFGLLVMLLLPMGYMTAEPFFVYIHNEIERLFGSDRFDETYKKYAKKHRTNHYKDFQWFNSSNYHSWNQKRYRDANGKRRQGTYAEQDSYNNTQSQSNAMPTKEAMLDILGLSALETNKKTIKSAYRKLARKYHPDIIESKDVPEAEKQKAAQKMQAINGAYDWLEDNGFA